MSSSIEKYIVYYKDTPTEYEGIPAAFNVPTNAIMAVTYFHTHGEFIWYRKTSKGFVLLQYEQVPDRIKTQHLLYTS